MTEFPSTEADELVTRQFLRAEPGSTRGELLGEMAALRVDVAERLQRQTVWLGGAIATALRSSEHSRLWAEAPSVAE